MFPLQIVFWYMIIHPNVQLLYAVKQAVKINSCCHIQYTNLVHNSTNISKMQHELKKIVFCKPLIIIWQYVEM